MSRGSSIRSLASTVGRLEKAARRGPKHCAFCRHIRGSSPGPNAPEEEVLNRKCEFCYSEFAVHLPTQEAELWRMFFSYTLEDAYTDPKAHAFMLWLGFTPRFHATPGPSKEGGPLAPADTKSSEELDQLIDRKLTRLTAKYGEPFPDHYRLIEAVEERERASRDASVFAPGLKELRRKRTDYLICLELEKIIWGGTRAETEAAVERLSLEMDELVRAYAEAEERRREEWRIKNLELVNSLRARQGLPPRLVYHGR